MGSGFRVYGLHLKLFRGLGSAFSLRVLGLTLVLGFGDTVNVGFRVSGMTLGVRMR